MTSPPKRVLIIGAGLGGTALAIGLAKRSIPSIIFELRETRGSLGGAVNMAPNALRVLDRLGVWEHIADKGYQYEDIRFMNESGGVVGDYPNGSRERFGYPTMRIKRFKLLDALHDEAGRLGIEIRFSKTAVKVEQSDSEAIVHFADGTQETGDLVVGFDGIHSRVRASAIEEDVVPKYTGYTGIGGNGNKKDIKFPTDKYKMPAMIFGQKGHFALFPDDPTGENVGCFSTCPFDSERTRAEWAEFERTHALDYMKDRLKTWGEPVKSLVASLDPTQVHIWPIYELPNVPRWHYKRLVIAGDAIHAMSPNGGQGAAQAFEDGALLVRVLSMVSETYPLETALQQWEAKRRERLAFVLDFTHNSTNMRAETSYLGELIKEWGLWAYLKVAGKRMSGGVADYDVEKVELSK